MRGNISLRAVFVCSMAVAAMCAIPAGATDLTWDTATGDSAVTDGSGTWLNPDMWTADGGNTNTTWNSATPDNAIIGAGGTGNYTITLDANVDAGTVLFDSFTNKYTVTGNFNLDVSGGITSSANAGHVQINSWISGTGGLTVNNAPGRILTLTANTNNTYSGNTVVNSGILQLGTGYSNSNSVPSTSNLEINGGTVTVFYYNAGFRTLGSGPGELQITGGASGFTCRQADMGDTVKINNDSNYEVVWGGAGEGAATGYFNPSTLVLGDGGAGAGQATRFANPVDLNGATRTVACNSTTAVHRNYDNRHYSWAIKMGGVFSRAISNNDGNSTAGLIKTGPGALALEGANTYDGGTTINEGGVLFVNTASMPAAGTVAVNTGTALMVSVGGGGQWTTDTSGNGTVGGLLAGLGGQAGSTVTYTGDVTLGLDVTGTQTYAGTIADVGDSLGITMYSEGAADTLILSGDNSYTGPTTVSSGTLQLSHDNAIGGANAELILGDGPEINSHVVVDEGVSLNLKSLTFGAGGHPHTVTGGTLAFSAGGSIDHPVTNKVNTITSAITGSPTVDIAFNGNKSYFGPDNIPAYQGLNFAPTSGTVTLGTVNAPPVGYGGDKAGLWLGGTTTGNSVDTVVCPGGTYGTLVKIGSGTWTVGDVRIGSVVIDDGTLIGNGKITTSYSGFNVTGSGRIAGDVTLEDVDRRGGPRIYTGGTVAPGNGVGTITVSYGTGGGVPTPSLDDYSLSLRDGSMYEWEIGDDAGDVITDTIHITEGGLFLQNFTLKVLDAGGSVADGTRLSVFTYDTGVSIDMTGFDNAVTNFNTDGLGAGWAIGALSLVDDGTGIIYLTGLSNSLLGDANGDGVVDSADYIMVKRHFGGAPAVGTEGSGGDFNENGTVDWDDLQTLMEGMNSSTGGAPIPEPATMGLLAVGALALIRRRRRA